MNLAPKLLPLAIVMFNIGEGECRPVLSKKKLRITQGLNRDSSSSAVAEPAHAEWVTDICLGSCVPRGSCTHEALMNSFVLQFTQ